MSEITIHDDENFARVLRRLGPVGFRVGLATGKGQRSRSAR